MIWAEVGHKSSSDVLADNPFFSTASLIRQIVLALAPFILSLRDPEPTEFCAPIFRCTAFVELTTPYIDIAHCTDLITVGAITVPVRTGMVKITAAPIAASPQFPSPLVDIARLAPCSPNEILKDFWSTSVFIELVLSLTAVASASSSGTGVPV